MGSPSHGSVYEEWKLELPSIPPRSTLYSLEPIGVGTPLVECLSSYIARLAETHCVLPGILMQKVIVPLVQQSPTYKGSWREMNMKHGQHSARLNGTQRPAACAVYAFESLTLQRSLRFLTLLTWAEVFSPSRLTRPGRAWCPACLEEWRITGQVIYEPLLWTLRAVTLCTRHQCMLSTSCPHQECQREAGWLTWTSLPGYCPFCRQWQGTLTPASREINEDDLLWQKWITEQLGTLFMLAPTVEVPPPRTRIYSVLNYFCQQMTQGRMRAFARSLGIPWSTVVGWQFFQGIPQLETLLSMCAVWGVSFYACLFDEVTNLSFQPEAQGRKPQRARSQPVARGFWATPQIRHVLELVLTSNEEPPPSVGEVARRLGCSPTSLNKHHKEMCDAISARYQAYRQNYTQAKIQQECEDVQQAARQIADQGKRPTRRKLAEVLTKPGILREPEVREAWQEVLREIDGNV